MKRSFNLNTLGGLKGYSSVITISIMNSPPS